MAHRNSQCGIADVCRLCGKEEAFLLPIFSKSGKDKHIANKIEICLPKLKISRSGELSKAICYKCMFILEQCSDFCIRATNANAVMTRQYSNAAQPCCSSSDETQMPPRKRIKHVNADKHGKFPHQSDPHQWCTMGDDITSSGSSEDSLPRRTSQINIKLPASTATKKMQEEIMLGEGTAIYQTGHSMKAKARGPSERSEAAPVETSKPYKRKRREFVRNTVARARHATITTNSNLDVTQKTTSKDKQFKALFESKWIEDPEYLLSPERESDCESDTNKSWSSARTTLSDIFGRVPRAKNSKPKDQQVPSRKCVNSMQDSAIKKVPMWEQQLCPGSNTESESCGGLTPKLGPQWCQKK